jgi:hypothetical protein
MKRVYKRKTNELILFHSILLECFAVLIGKYLSCEVLGLRRVVVEIFPLLRCYEALVSQFVIDISGQYTIPVFKGLVGPFYP